MAPLQHSSASRAEFYVWSFPGSPARFDLSLSAVQRIEEYVKTQPCAAGSAECHGLLLGEIFQSGVAEIRDFRALPAWSVRAIQTALAGMDDSSAGLRPVGYFRTQSEGRLYLNEYDLLLARTFFRDPHCAFLLIQSSASGPPGAGFFFWDRGQIHGDYCFMEFPLDSRLLSGPAAGSQEPEAGRQETARPVVRREGSGALMGNFPSVPGFRAVAIVLLLLLAGITGFRGVWPAGRIIRNRATVLLTDAFQSGLPGWKGAGAWNRTWFADSQGAAWPGRLALYEPSLALTNYRFEFFTSIARGGIGWVVRARDPANYYAMKLRVVRAGPLRQVSLSRYPVVAGRRGVVQQVPLRSVLANATSWRVGIEVDGATYRIFGQGQLVDTWTDHELETGGVGFFTERGERASVSGMTVASQDDFLGRLCAALAASGTPAGK